MTTFSKKDFENKNINELVNSDGGFIEGDRNVTNNSEIETGPVQAPFNDDSDYEKGISTTTDRASRYRAPKFWWNSYFGGTAYSHGVRNSSTIQENDYKQMIKELLSQKSPDNDVVTKYLDTDINKNNIPDLEELSNPAAVNKTKDFLNVIKNNHLTAEQIAIMINYILKNVDIKQIPNNYKNIIIKKLR